MTTIAEELREIARNIGEDFVVASEMCGDGLVRKLGGFWQDRLIALAERVEKESGWQPIATAPQDELNGVDLWVGGKVGYRVIGFWDEEDKCWYDNSESGLDSDNVTYWRLSPPTPFEPPKVQP